MGRNARNRPPQTQGQPSITDFARRVGEGTAPPRDRFGRPIGRGHYVMYKHMGADPVFEVIDVSPILDPRQIGWVKLALTVMIPLRVMANQPTDTLVIVGEKADSVSALPPASPPPAEPPAQTPGPTLVLTDADLPERLTGETEPPPLSDADAPPDEHAEPPARPDENAPPAGEPSDGEAPKE